MEGQSQAGVPQPQLPPLRTGRTTPPDRPLPPIPQGQSQQATSPPSSPVAASHAAAAAINDAVSSLPTSVLPGQRGSAVPQHPTRPDAQDATLTDTPPRSSSIATAAGLDNPFGVDLVIPFDASTGSATDRSEGVTEATADYNRLINALEGVGGLRIASRAGRNQAKGSEEVWVFVGASEAKIADLVAEQRLVDEAHGLRDKSEGPVSPATRLRLLYVLLTSPKIQHGLGITPQEGQWKRVKSIVALHDEARDNAWVERWAVADWKIGLLRGLDDNDQEMLSRDHTPSVRLYFNFLVSYQLSLLPIAVVSFLFWMYAPADSFPPLYAFCLALYSTSWLAWWRIKERKLAVKWGVRGLESQAGGQMRPQYVEAHGITSVAEAGNVKDDFQRDSKVVLSVPIIMVCGAILGCVLTTIFMLEAFVGHIWTGFGSAIVPFIPTILFSVVVPQIVGIFGQLSKKLVHWEDHPTPRGATNSLTAKTFALNAIVAYLGLFLSALVYLPFGGYIMAYVSTLLHGHNPVHLAHTEGAHVIQPEINTGRLKSQVFAYLVTNQVINTFLELGLPFILRFINKWREGKASIKGAFSKHDEKVPSTEEDVEKKFLDKVEAELELPEYTTFVDYGEMITQFGYVVTWGIVWPLAPVFALINNYFELRSDALKICKHVRRPIDVRVETIGTWMDAASIIAWVGGWTSVTLIMLFRPNASYVGTYKATTASFLASYDAPPTVQHVLPTILPVVVAALAASHGYLVLKWVVESVAERVFWFGSPEQQEEQQEHDEISARILKSRMESEPQSQPLAARAAAQFTEPAGTELAGRFWNGGEEGASVIGGQAKTE